MMTTYRGCCERFSIGILTILETWVALDKVQCALNPLLAQCSPGLPAKILEPLLPRRKDQTLRAQAVQQYLHTRQHPHVTEVLDLFSNMHRFFMKFFDQSKPHQKTRSIIDSEAAAARQQKTVVWQGLEEQYALLVQQYADRDHDVRPQKQHDEQTCEKCLIEAEADGLKISKYEWPLPDDEEAQKVLIVELDPPEGCRSWRDATFAIISNLGRQWDNLADGKKPEDDLFLTTYKYLLGKYIHGEARIMLKTIKKPVQLTGLKTIRIPADLKNVCIKNDSVWAFYDTEGCLDIPAKIQSEF